MVVRGILVLHLKTLIGSAAFLNWAFLYRYYAEERDYYVKESYDICMPHTVSFYFICRARKIKVNRKDAFRPV